MSRSMAWAWAVAFLLLGLLPPLVAPAAAPRTPRALSFQSGEIVVIADKGALDVVPGGAPLARDPRLAGVLSAFGLEKARGVGPTLRPGASRTDRVWVLASARAGFDPVLAARALRETGAVRAASPNYRFSLFATHPNDFYLADQWYVDDGGLADIRLPLAWDSERGDTSVVIAIMDTGVDTGHPDLMSQIWHNPGEIPGNGLDDDGNGLIDDFEGWDFGREDNNPNPEYMADEIGLDVGFHGTFCAGIAAAATNNAVGIAGAGWNCRIMPLKVANPDSGITSSAIAGAFVYAVDQGASVISMSFGGPGDPGVPEFFQALIDMATYSGVLCVAAAGNDGADVPTYPAACENVLAVAATDQSGGLASFSNYGSWVDVAAPGSFMWSTICRNYTLSDLDQIFYLYFFYWDGENPYMYGDGTSFACPLTAGVCGLVRSKYPYLTPQLVAQRVIATGSPMAAGLVKVNAFAAVSGIPTSVAVEEGAPSAARVLAVPNPVVGSGEFRFSVPVGGWARLVLYDASGRRIRSIAEGMFSAGVHVAPWDGRGERGSRLPAAVYFARLENGETSMTTKVILLSR